MIYVGTPYSDPNPAVTHFRWRVNQDMIARWINQGLFVYSPIVHCHELAQDRDLPRGFDFWRDWDLHMISLSECLYVIQLPGWDRSEGLAEETEFAVKNGIQVVWHQPFGDSWEALKQFL